MKIYITLIVILFSIPVNADTLEPFTCEQIKVYECSQQKNCCEHSLVEADVRQIKYKLNKHIEKQEINSIKTDDSIKSLEIDQAVIKSQSDSLEDSMWNTLNNMATIFYGIFGLGITSGGIFIWRENSTLKLRFESEIQEISKLKMSTENKLTEVIQLLDSTKKKYDEELSSARTRYEVQNMLSSDKIDSDFIYSKIRFLEQFPTSDNLILLMKVLKNENIDAVLKTAIHNSISKIKIDLKNNGVL